MRHLSRLMAAVGVMAIGPHSKPAMDAPNPRTPADAVAAARAEGLTSDPTAVSWGAGRIDVFARGPDNALWHRWFENQWSGWENLGGSLASGPDVAAWGSGRLDVFARGTDNTLQHKWYQGSWSGWESLGGGLTSDPAAVAWGSGRLDVFARGGDNALWHIWYAGSWSSWESLGGVLASSPDAASWGSGRLDVFARGTDNTLQHKWYQGSWSGWESLGGGLSSDPAAVAWGSGRLDVFARGGDNALYHKSYAGAWSGWESLGGALSSGPDASSWGAGRLDVFALGANAGLYHLSYGGNWSAWEGLGAPAAVTAGTAVVAHSARYRVSLNGTMVVQATPHDLLELDGKGDEVYFLSQVERFDRASAPNGPYQVESKFAYAPSAIYGDVNTFPNRIRAGTRSASGGLQAGDWVPTGVNVLAPYAEPTGGQLPLLIWSGTLRDGRDVLLVHPVVMEWAGTGIDGHMGADGLDGPTIFRSDKCPKDQQYLLPAVQSQLGTTGITVVQEQPIGEDVPYCARPKEKRFPEYGAHAPIGLLAGTNDPGAFVGTDYFLVLTREKIEAAMGSRNWVVAQVQRRNTFRGSAGVYVVFVLIERLP